MSKEVKDRRALLKGIVAGSAVVGGSKALPEQWSSPLTDSVVLPSHGRTTGDKYEGDINDGYQPSTYQPDIADATLQDTDGDRSDTIPDTSGGDYTWGDFYWPNSGDPGDNPSI